MHALPPLSSSVCARALLGLALLATGCAGDDPKPAPAGEASPAAKEAAPKKSAASPKTAAAKEEAPPAEPVALPEGVAVEGAPTVALVGHGLRVELRPPFQLARMGHAMGEHADMVVWSWWDVSAEAAGKNGRSGLYNISIVPGEGITPGAPLRATQETKGRHTHTVLRQGKKGSFLRLPEGHNALGGMGAVSAGPVDPVWRFQVDDGPLLEWTAPLMVHSGDPKKGDAVLFLQRPQQPWGPWPEAK